VATDAVDLPHLNRSYGNKTRLRLPATAQMIYTCQLHGEIRSQTAFFHVRLVVILYFATSFYISIQVLVQEEEWSDYKTYAAIFSVLLLHPLNVRYSLLLCAPSRVSLISSAAAYVIVVGYFQAKL
jgi:hypothetical protein